MLIKEIIPPPPIELPKPKPKPKPQKSTNYRRREIPTKQLPAHQNDKGGFIYDKDLLEVVKAVRVGDGTVSAKAFMNLVDEVSAMWGLTNEQMGILISVAPSTVNKYLLEGRKTDKKVRRDLSVLRRLEKLVVFSRHILLELPVRKLSLGDFMVIFLVHEAQL